MMTQWLREFVRRQIRRVGFDIQRYPDPGPMAYYFSSLGIDTVLDVGANQGYYGRSLRDMGFRGRIISFEPVPAAFDILQAECHRDGNWECHQYALGDVDMGREITVSESTVFSSFLPVKTFVQEIQATSRPQRIERVRVRTLDSCLPELRLQGQTLWLKSDTQGFELQVLRGVSESLKAFRVVQLEMSLRPIYEGQPTFETLISYMRDQGFVVSDLIRGFCNGRCGELIEVDGIFVRP